MIKVSQLLILPDLEAVSRAAAERFAVLARSSDPFSVALSGGNTPRRLYELLATPLFCEQIPWRQVHVFWSDERCVPPDDPASNYRLAREALLAHVPLPAGNVHRVPGELGPAAAAQAYAQELREFFDVQWPTFDLVLLGLGDDGHTASLFPDAPALNETSRPVLGVTAHYGNRPARRVTLTLPAINAARQVMFLVGGAAKAEIVRAVLEGPAARFPAQHVRPTPGHLAWLIDAAAAAQLRRRA